MCFGGGDSKPQTVVQQTQQELPAWVTKGGEDLYLESKPLANRDFPAYPVADRIAPFNQDQGASFDLARGNVGSYQDLFGQAVQGVGAGAQAVGQTDIDQYMNPYTQNVIDTTTAEINRQYDRDKINRNSSMAKRGSYLNEDRRAAIDQLGEESRNRVVAETVARLQSGAFGQALGQANIEKGKQTAAGSQYAQLAPLNQQLGYADVGALQGIGDVQQAQEQRERGLAYDEFTNQFNYPQEQLNWLLGVLRGAPQPVNTTTTSDQLIAQPNPFAQALGGVATVAGAGNKFGWWGPQ